MKRLLSVITFLVLPFFCGALEPVGYTVPFKLASGVPAGAVFSEETIAFEGAGFIKIHLDNLLLNENDVLSLFNGDNVVFNIEGPFEGPLWLPSVLSDTAKLIISRGSAFAPSFSIDEVGVGLAQSPEPESICGIDDRRNAVCYDSEKQQKGDAIGRMLFQSGGGWYLCTGSLVSSNGHFLTCNHCIEDQYGAGTMEVWWRYQASSCGGTQGEYEYVTTGSQFVTTDAGLDFTLLQLDDSTPAQRYGYLEAANRQPQKGETIWIPQHGGGMIKKFAVESDMDEGGTAKIIDDNLQGWVNASDIGYYADTEGGASGSPVLDSENKIMALHHFGLPSGYSCDSYYMNQGVKMSLIYPKIAPYLDQPNPPDISSIKKIANPFRLIVKGKDIDSRIAVYIGSDTTPWSGVSYKGSTKIVIKKGAILKQRFPKGVAVPITFVNPDGGTTICAFTR